MSHFAPLLILTCLPACWVPLETGRQLQSDVRALRKELSEAQKGVAEQRGRLDEQILRAESKVEEVGNALRDLNRASRMSDAEFGVKLERVIREVQELRGSAELADYRLGKLEKAMEPIASRMEDLERGSSGRDAPASSREDDGAKSPPEGKRDLMAHAAKLVKQKKVADARGVYRSVIHKWPKEAGLTDEAYFRLGDLYFSDRNHVSAVQEYIKVVEGFPTGKYVDDAYFKIGLCSVELGNLEDAVVFFNEIISNHRKSPLWKAAKAKLDEVKSRIDKERKPSSAASPKKTTKKRRK